MKVYPFLQGNDGNQEGLASLNTLFIVIINITKAMVSRRFQKREELQHSLSFLQSPFTPFFTEYLYQNLRRFLTDDQREDSVHFTMFPAPRSEFINLEIEQSVAHMQSTIELGRAARDRRKMPIKVQLRLSDMCEVSQYDDILWAEPSCGIQTSKKF